MLHEWDIFLYIYNTKNPFVFPSQAQDSFSIQSIGFQREDYANALLISDLGKLKSIIYIKWKVKQLVRSMQNPIATNLTCLYST